MSSSPTTTYEVQLAIYDLSNGMARQLSAQFLGPNHTIDIIPHTALVVYGLEYYFGMGIESCPPTQFRQSKQIYPIDVITLGHTSLSQADFESWCRSVSGVRYSPQSYDLMNRNCNNFSYDAATQGLRLPGERFPSWILEVPQRFLSSPMGMMVRPILEGMQVTSSSSGGGVGGGSNGAPFAGASGGMNQFAASSPSSSVVAADNPWANIPSKKEEEKQSSATKEVSSKESSAAVTTTTTPTLNSYNRFFLSDDVAVVSICISKLTKNANDVEKISIESLGRLLAEKTSTKDYHNEEEEEKEAKSKIISSSTNILLQQINTKTKSGNVAFALMLLRLIVLHSSCNQSVLPDIVHTVAIKLLNATTTAKEGGSGNSAAVQSMSWCVLSNAISKCNASSSSLAAFFSDGNNQDIKVTLEALIDAAFQDISSAHQKRVEVRQSAAAFLYNVAHSFALEQQQDDDESGEVSDVMVLLLCGSLENILEEQDGTVKLRRLLVAAKMLHSDNDDDEKKESELMIKTLAIDLGFFDVVETMAKQQSSGDDGIVKKENDDVKAVRLANEIHSILSSV